MPTSTGVVLEGDQAAAAAEQWLLWWRLMLDQAVREFGTRKAEDPGDDMMAKLEARTSWPQEVCGPPDFAGISAWPQLRSAPVGTHSAHHAWALQESRRSTVVDRLFAWQVVCDAVHDAAASLGVPVSEMDAVAHVVPVERGSGPLSPAPVAGSVRSAWRSIRWRLRKLFVSAFPGTA